MKLQVYVDCFRFRLILVALFLGIVIAGIVASIILILKLKGRKAEIAFGPYIAIEPLFQ